MRTNDETPTAPPVVQRLRDVQTELGLTQFEMAEYLGVPHRTLCNWLQGARKPGPVVLRLLDVLGTMRVFAPGLHAQFMPEGKR